MRIINKAARTTQKFTMVEIMVVCVIISILMGLGVAGYTYAQQKLKISRTEALIARISTAIRACKEKHGFYPPSDNATGLLVLQLCLTDDEKQKLNNDTLSDTDKKTPTYKFFQDYANMVEYEKLKADTKTFGSTEAIIDAFGYPLYYRCPGVKNIHSFDLYSVGADGKIGNPSNNIFLWGENFVPFTTKNIDFEDDVDELKKFDTKNFDDIGFDL